MKKLTIFCDLAADESTMKVLEHGIHPHKVVFPARRAASVLAKSEPDPALADADIAFGQPDVAGVLDATRLCWLQLSSAGYTRFDTPTFRKAASSRALTVTNSSSVYAQPCAEHVLAFMLAHARRLPWALQTTCQNGAEPWAKIRSTSILLQNQTVVLLGFGAIAVHLLELLKPFKMKILALRRNVQGTEEIPILKLEDLDHALTHADHVINLLPDNPASSRFMSTGRFAAMKKGAVFYNIGRGTTVDQEALLGALRSGNLDAAWLDVTDPEPLPEGHPLLSATNCFITPHTAGGHRDEFHALIQHFLNNLQRFVRGEALMDRVM